MPESTKKSCRRALNFESTEQPIDENSTCKENDASMHLGKGVSPPEGIQAPSMSHPKYDSPRAEPNANSVKRKRKRKSEVMLGPNDANSNNGGVSTTGLQMDDSKRKHSAIMEHTDTSSMNLTGARYNGLQAYQGAFLQFSNIQKKRRSGKRQISRISNLTALAAWAQENARAHTYASSSHSWNFGSEYNAARVPITFEDTVHNIAQTFESILAIQDQTKQTKRRSKVSTKVYRSTKQLGNDEKQVFQNAEKPAFLQFPNIQKKRRSGKGQISKISNLTALAAWAQEKARAHTYASSSHSWNFGSEYNPARVPITFEDTVHNIAQTFERILAIQDQTKQTNRRSKVSTKVYRSTKQLGNDDKQVFQNAEKPTSIDALVAEMRASVKKKKRTKKRSSIVNSVYSRSNEMYTFQSLGLLNSEVLQNVRWEDKMEALGEKFRHLDINKEDRVLASE